MLSDWRNADQFWCSGMIRDQPSANDPIDYIINKIWSSKLPSETEAKFLIKKASEILKHEPNILRLSPPITLCGDIHGQFDDLIEIFRIGGLPPYTKYLFLGDYVDRGSMSCLVIFLLCALKIKYPSSFYLLRGNHECMNITQVYGFKQEVLVNYRSESLYQMFESLFNSIPIAALIQDIIFCVHGGIAQEAMTISSIESINRFVEIPPSGALCDLLWSDPADDDSNFSESTRNTGHKFGSSATNEFFKTNNINLIVRAHETKNDGCCYSQDKKVLTVFSAPNYEHGNKGGIVVIDNDLIPKFVRFKQGPPHETFTDVLVKFVY